MKTIAPADPDSAFNLELPDGRPFDVVGFGQNAVDDVFVVPSFPLPDRKTPILDRQKQAGGQVAAAITFAAKVGLKGKYIGKVGSDENGLFCLESLRRRDIDTSSVRIAQGARNHFSLIMVDQPTGARTILWERDPLLRFGTDELSREEICAGRVLLLDDSDPDAALQAGAWARNEHIPVVADLDRVGPETADLIQIVDFLIVSADFPSQLTRIEDASEALLALDRICPGFVAATQGSSGVLAVLGERCLHFPAFPVRTVDTTGAGDVFHGAFIYGLLKNWPLRRIMTFANAAAALNCTRWGACSNLPSLEEIIQLIGLHPAIP